MFKILFYTQTFQFFLTCLIHHNETIEFDQQSTFLFPTTISFSIGFLTPVINLPNKTEAINSNLGILWPFADATRLLPDHKVTFIPSLHKTRTYTTAQYAFSELSQKPWSWTKLRSQQSTWRLTETELTCLSPLIYCFHRWLVSVSIFVSHSNLSSNSVCNMNLIGNFTNYVKLIQVGRKTFLEFVRCFFLLVLMYCIILQCR